MLNDELMEFNFTLLYFLLRMLVTSCRPAPFPFRLRVTNIYKDLVVLFDLGRGLLVIVFLKQFEFGLELVGCLDWSARPLVTILAGGMDC